MRQIRFDFLTASSVKLPNLPMLESWSRVDTGCVRPGLVKVE